MQWYRFCQVAPTKDKLYWVRTETYFGSGKYESMKQMTYLGEGDWLAPFEEGKSVIRNTYCEFAEVKKTL